MKVHAYSNYFAFFVYGEETRYIEAFGFLPNVLPSYFMANGTVSRQHSKYKGNSFWVSLCGSYCSEPGTLYIVTDLSFRILPQVSSNPCCWSFHSLHYHSLPSFGAPVSNNSLFRLSFHTAAQLVFVKFQSRSAFCKMVIFQSLPFISLFQRLTSLPDKQHQALAKLSPGSLSSVYLLFELSILSYCFSCVSPSGKLTDPSSFKTWESASPLLTLFLKRVNN